MPKKIKNTEEKMEDFLFDITAEAEVTHDHVEDWFKEKGSVNNTLLYLADRGLRLENWLGEGKKDKEFIVNEMIKFFRDAYFRAEETLVHSPELKDVTAGMVELARYSLLDIKKTALLAILICEYKIASLKKETVNKK